MSQNIKVFTNINLSQKKQAQDLRGNPVTIEQPIEGVKRKGKWNGSLQGLNQFVSNITSVAREDIVLKQKTAQEKNKSFCFVNNYFKDIEFETEEIDPLDNLLSTMVDKYFDGVESAYDKAKKKISNYEETQTKEKQKIKQFGETVDNRLEQIEKSDKKAKNTKKNKFEQEIQRMYKMIKKVVEHIQQQGGEEKFIRIEELIKQKEHLTCDYFKDKKQISDKTTSLTQLQELRMMLSKKTDQMTQLKQIHGEDFLAQFSLAEIMSESGQNFSEGQQQTNTAFSDKVSVFQDDNQKKTKIDAWIYKFYDLDNLKDKWGGKISDQGVKEKIRLILVRKMLGDIQQVQARQYRQDLEELRQKILRNPLLAKAQVQNEETLTNYERLFNDDEFIVQIYHQQYEQSRQVGPCLRTFSGRKDQAYMKNTIRIGGDCTQIPPNYLKDKLRRLLTTKLYLYAEKTKSKQLSEQEFTFSQ